MPDPRRAHCARGCGRHKSECGPISWTGLCSDCAQARAAANLIDLHHREGYFDRRHRRATVKALGGVLVDELPAPQ
jgi:hypothetical protein